jgi:hypothetical protein
MKKRHQTFVHNETSKEGLYVYLKSTLSFRQTMEGTRETQRVIRRTDNTSWIIQQHMNHKGKKILAVHLEKKQDN